MLMKEKGLHDIFIVGMILKAANAVLELAGGLAILLISKAFIVTSVLLLTKEELLEDPKDLVANYIITSAHALTISTQYFIATYLLVHGAIKVVLTISLLRRKLWAYPAAIAVFGIFVIYQIFRWSITGSLWYIVLTIFDIVLIYLTWREYKNLELRLAI